MTYGMEALRRLREQQAQPAEPQVRTPLLSQVPPDAPMDDATLTVWNGERFVSWDKWIATAPFEAVEKQDDASPAIPANASCIVGGCSGRKVWLVKDGERWFMYVGSRKATGRRRDFASPYLEHAIRTAEQWYGVPGGGWHAEKECDGSGHKAADLPPQDSAVETGTRKRGNHDLDLDGHEPGR